ncbi:hypothetical protein EVAR_17418_1 [Eumeta japonica]|uniref:Uncharacterized protein n=1 Tax=Eumeta variegata TaxID=151549 RepID=A0A4C1VA64_EUMVA|nr:hypothetical protein EVAR_17418_1 [Eumeta japonica]
MHESAVLYKHKKSLSNNYLLSSRELETRMSYLKQPHPSILHEITYVPLEAAHPKIVQKIAGPYVYTNGSKIGSKVGAALTWWEKNDEVKSHLLDPSCTVF